MRPLSAATSATLVLLASTAFAVFAVGDLYHGYKPTAAAGGATSVSASFRQSSLAGQTAVGATASDGFVIHHGFWGGPGTSITAVDEPAENLPRVHALGAAFPNPFNPATRVRYDLPAAGRVRLRIYDLKGRLVRTLLDAAKPAGRHEAVWDGRDGAGSAVASGTYVLKMRAGDFAARRKLTLLK